MSNWFRELGFFHQMMSERDREKKITNFIVFVYVLTSAIIGALLFYERGFDLSIKLLLLSVFYLVLLLILSRQGYDAFSRISLTFLVPLFTMTISVLAKKFPAAEVQVFNFYNTRTIILAGSILPFLLLRTKEKYLMILAVSIYAVSIFCFDVIHHLFGVGPSDLLNISNTRYFTTARFFDISFIFIIGALLFFKFSYQRVLDNYSLVVDEISTKNNELKKAQKTIQEQSTTLKRKNIELEKAFSQTSIELKNSNEELIKHNNELLQFSNTVSHNMRGPVASLLGLVNLLTQERDQALKNEIIGHIGQSAQALDLIIKDLNKVMDIRHQLFQIKEQVDIKHEVEQIIAGFRDPIEKGNVKLEVNIRQGNIYAVRSYLHSILYNLISNAIKYRDPGRDSRITVSSEVNSGDILIKVADNGIGISLEKHRSKLFGMYKRFHDQTDGKGLGLFLAREQTEAMGGTIEVQSELGKGSTFMVSVPVVDKKLMERQIYYQSDIGTIYYDATRLVFALVWHQNPSSEEYRDIFQRNLEVFRTYPANQWIGDVKHLGLVDKKDRIWFVENVLVEATEVGVKSFAIVKEPDDGKEEDYWNAMKSFCDKQNILFQTFHTMDEALNWDIATK